MSFAYIALDFGLYEMTGGVIVVAGI